MGPLLAYRSVLRAQGARRDADTVKNHHTKNRISRTTVAKTISLFYSPSHFPFIYRLDAAIPNVSPLYEIRHMFLLEGKRLGVASGSRYCSAGKSKKWNPLRI